MIAHSYLTMQDTATEVRRLVYLVGMLALEAGGPRGWRLATVDIAQTTNSHYLRFWNVKSNRPLTIRVSDHARKRKRHEVSVSLDHDLPEQLEHLMIALSRWREIDDHWRRKNRRKNKNRRRRRRAIARSAMPRGPAARLPMLTAGEGGLA